MKKRARGEGSIRQRGEGTYQIRYRVNGKRETKTFQGTAAEARAELRKLLTGIDDGTHVSPNKVTVTEFLERYVKHWAPLNIGKKTLEGYEGWIANQINPHIGGALMQQLRADKLSEFYATLLREGGMNKQPLHPRTVGHVHRFLHSAFEVAVSWDIIKRNPVHGMKPPKVDAAEIEIISEDQIRRVLARFRDHWLYTVAVLALATGMRRGELLALRWSDVELNGAKPKVRVERSLEQTKAGGLQFKAPKTKRSRRTIKIDPDTAALLRAHLTAQQEQRIALGLGRANDALVFGSPEGDPRTPNSLSKAWSDAMTAMGLACTFHGLRHTHVSSLIAKGVNIMTISRRLGHATATVTLNVYGHLLPDSDDEAATVMGAMIGRVLA